MKLKKLWAISIFLILFSQISWAETPANYINSLKSQLSQSTAMIIKLTQKNIKFKQALHLTLIQLTNSTKVIKDLKNQVIKDQKEILNLRNAIAKNDKLISSFKYSSIGFGLQYPLGAEINYSFIIPRLPIGIFTEAGINNKLSFFLGAGLQFRF